MAVASTTRATEGKLYLRSSRARVYIENTRGDIAHGSLDAIDILRVDGTGEAKLGVVIDGDGLFKGAYLG